MALHAVVTSYEIKQLSIRNVGREEQTLPHAEWYEMGVSF